MHYAGPKGAIWGLPTSARSNGAGTGPRAGVSPGERPPALAGRHTRTVEYSSGMLATRRWLPSAPLPNLHLLDLNTPGRRDPAEEFRTLRNAP